MSTVLQGPRHRRTSPARPASPLTGTVGLLRLFLRRDRIVLPLWVLLLSVPLSTVYVASILSVYPEAAQRAAFVASVTASPAQRALYGNIYNDSVGTTAMWKAGMFHALIGVAVILTVIRHTRGDEETGRTELLDSTVVGRYAGLTAALLLAGGASLLTGLIGTAGLLGTDLPAAGSVAFGSALAASGLVFAAVAAVCAQLTSAARTARGLAFAILGAAFAFRAIGDAGNGALSWLSPLGWSLQVRPYAGERWEVLGLHAITAAALTVAAYLLLNSRDVGAGLLADGTGPATAAGSLAGSFGLAWRLQRGSVLAWTIGLSLYALLVGSITHGIADAIGDSAQVREIIERFGGTAGMEDTFIAISFSFIGIGAAAQAISATLRLHGEEASGRAETVLGGAVSRGHWAASHLVFAVAGTAASLLAAGVVAGTAYGLAVGDLPMAMPRVVAAAAVQLPAVWLLAGLTLAIFGILPRFASAAWAVLVAAFSLYVLGSIAGMPQWILNLSPFAHTPRVPGEPFRAAPVIWLLAGTVALGGFGLLALHRRDIR
ncbi:MAG: ABC transporter permease [Mycobacterium sp.]|nr:ABC transporter permease [Mycobacterium sp.]